MTAARRILPGDSPPSDAIDRLVRVNHAGEYGAMRIYAGQLAVLKNDKSSTVIQEMAEQEKEHLDVFSRMMVERKGRPTVFMPVWHVAGFLLGAGTALLGSKAAMACTVAVESVIDRHYAAQEEALGDDELALKETIHRFRADEMHHHDIGLEHGAEEAPFYAVLRTAVEGATKLAIWVSTRW